ncbi:hypothetical protein H9Q09_21015 [Aurantimonas sp. DM33-3]|nr:hypothetical protein [Aurantimonas sp. DM33-3]
MRSALAEKGVLDAVAHRDSVVLFDWLLGIAQFQGISDANALAFTKKHGPVGWADIERTLARNPDCHRLRSYWHLDGCGYRKTAQTCTELQLLPSCPLPRHPLRNGRLSQGAYSLFLFIRDVCDGDLVSWLDERLEAADNPGHPERAALMRRALLEPMGHIFGVSNKLLSMALADLLLGGDPARERWVVTGASMIAIDTLVHNFLHRTGILRRFEAEHPYGPGCYEPGGCADLIEELAQRTDARDFNPTFPVVFPRFVQYAIWHFCAAGGLDICNGNKISDQHRCQSMVCPARQDCDRVSLKT